MDTKDTQDKLEGVELTDEQLESIVGGLTQDEKERIAEYAHDFKTWNMTRESAAQYGRSMIGYGFSNWTEEWVQYMVEHWDEF